MGTSFTAAAAASTEKSPREVWYVADKASKESAPQSDQSSALMAILTSKLSPADQAKAIALLPVAGGKPFSLHIERGQGKRTDLVMVEGDHRAKRLSPNLIKAIAANAEFVLGYIKKHKLSGDE